MTRTRREYERRVNRVIDYIEKHPSMELSLERLAQMAPFSPYHFHRVFKSITHETLFDFCQRLRIEKGALSLLTSPDRSILDIAQSCGFASSAAFARAFKARFGMSATEWRAGGNRRWREWRKNRKSSNAISKASKAPAHPKHDTVSAMKATKVAVRVQALPSFRVAYMRYVGPYGPQGIPLVWNKLRKWSEARTTTTKVISLGVAYDNPNIAAAHTCRYDACVVVPTDFVADKHVNIIDTASGSYAICEFKGTADEIEAAWERAFSAWLPDSGYEPDDNPCIEFYDGTGPDPKLGTFRCKLCLPVRPI